MTCIVGLVHGGQVFIGGDSAGVGGGYSLTVRSDRKVFKNQDFVMGFTSSFRMGQLLAFHMHPPSPREGVDLMTYMVTDFIDAASWIVICHPQFRRSPYSLRRGAQGCGSF